MNPKKAGIALVVIGAVLILSALFLFLYNAQEDAQAGMRAEEQLEKMQEIIDKQVKGENGNSFTDEENEQISTEMTIVEMDGYGYIGYLTIPSLEIDLPVMSDWDYERLKIAPCRQYGALATDDLVVAAHNYKRHFGNLSLLNEGDVVTFTDMNGTVTHYTVKKVETLEPEAVDAVQNSEHDLVLYTCTRGGGKRVASFCDRTSGEL